MPQTGIRKLRASLSDVLARVEAGDVVEITRHGRVVAVLVPPGRWATVLRREAGIDDDEPFALDAELFGRGER